MLLLVFCNAKIVIKSEKKLKNRNGLLILTFINQKALLVPAQYLSLKSIYEGTFRCIFLT